MRALVAVLLASSARPAWADTIAATSRITAVTVYPDGAKPTREVTFTAPGAGNHELLVTDLPYDSDPGLIRLARPMACNLAPSTCAPTVCPRARTR